MAFEFSEYSRVGVNESEFSNMLHTGRLATQQMTPTTTSSQSDEFSPETSLLYITITGNTSYRVEFGQDPVAKRTGPDLSQLLVPGQYGILVPKRMGYKMAVIEA